MNVVQQLENEWDYDGFLGRLRRGMFIPEEGRRFVGVVNCIEIPEDGVISKRQLSLLWYIPPFLSWQRRRVLEAGGDVGEYDSFVTEVQNALEQALGVP